MRTLLYFMVKSFPGLLVACLVCLPAHSQLFKQANNPLKLADRYFSAGEYYTAAYLYEQYLNPSKRIAKASSFPVYARKRKRFFVNKKINRGDILYKQAQSYRLAHYWEKADSAYRMCAGQADALYWQAVCERNLEKYDAAEKSLHAYLNGAAGGKQYTEEAEKELQTIQFIRQQIAKAGLMLINCKKISMPNSYEKGAYAVHYAGGQQYVVSSTSTDSAAAKDVNPHYSRLFYATMNNDSLNGLIPVGFPAPAIPENQSAASLSPDGNCMYFTQWKKENGHVVSGIYYSIKRGNGWSIPFLLQQVNTGGHNSKQPYCTADGKYLFFASDRPGGSGGFDIWYAPVQADGSTGTPVNAGAVINTAADEQAPFFHVNSSTLVFSSNGRPGMGGFDLYAAQGLVSAWNAPENLGYPVNSSRDDVYFFAPEKNALLFNAIIGSDRGSGCCIEAYRVTKMPKTKRLNGLVLDCKNQEPVTGAIVVLTFPSGKTREAKTDGEGRFVFDTMDFDTKDVTIGISKALYKDTTTVIKIHETDESSLTVDQLFNENLCIEKKFVLNPENVLTVFFDFDKSNIGEAAGSKLDSLYNILVSLPNARIQVSGYTDGKGSVAYNKILSDKRARACAAYLAAKGIAADRISFESFGACCPVEMELINGRDNPDGRSRNRRALINILKE